MSCFEVKWVVPACCAKSLFRLVAGPIVAIQGLLRLVLGPWIGAVGLRDWLGRRIWHACPLC